MPNEKFPINTKSVIPFAYPVDEFGDILAVGGNLSPENLLAAYRQGIFPWYSEGEPILWWSLNPRFVLDPFSIHVSRSLRKKIRKGDFSLALDRDFSAVIRFCKSVPRRGQESTWITQEMLEAYEEFSRLGYAHSVEFLSNGQLLGGLYGVSLGGCFFGESMFSLLDDASKIAFIALTGVLRDNNFGLIDCQQHTAHLETFGAIDVPRTKFLKLLDKELQKPTIQGPWNQCFPEFPFSKLWESILG